MPELQGIQAYQEAIQKMVLHLSAQPEIKAIYRIGGVSSPGISDIDLYVVFHEGSSYHDNPVKGLTRTDRYLFTHNLFGTSEKLAVQMEPFTFFGKYELIYGTDVGMLSFTLPPDQVPELEKQVALEYLAKAFLSICSNTNAGVIKVRGLLLHAKALLLDLNLLGVTSGPLYSLLQKMLEIRSNWFTNASSLQALSETIEPYKLHLQQLLQEQITINRFYIDSTVNKEVAKNMTLHNGSKVEVKTHGFKIPGLLNSRIKKLRSIHNRISHMELVMPLTHTNIPTAVEKRFTLFRTAESLNAKNFPAFLPTAYGLHLFKPN
ncbi:MAG TPA: hypothetical protein VFW78_11565 [Bacteroidia bacterium]|nr:hypothetical protein [Bacteroidia bacterium]